MQSQIYPALSGAPCPTCNATGYIPHTLCRRDIKLICTTCNGTQVVNSPEACNTCKGTGSQIQAYIGVFDCPVCNGSGLKLVQTKAITATNTETV